MKVTLALFTLSAIASAVHAAPAAKAPVTVSVYRRPSTIPAPERRATAAAAALAKYSPNSLSSRNLERRGESTPLVPFLVACASVDVLNLVLYAVQPDIWVTGPNCQSDGLNGCLPGAIHLPDPLIVPTGKTFSDLSSQTYRYLPSYTTAVNAVATTEANDSLQEAAADMSVLLGLSPKFDPSEYYGIYGNKGFPDATQALFMNSFAMYLSVTQNGGQGDFTINGFDSSKLQSSSQNPFTFEPADWSSGFWMFSTANGGVRINNEESGFTVGNSIADSGTTQIILHNNDNPAIYSRLDADSKGNIDCSRKGKGLRAFLGYMIAGLIAVSGQRDLVPSQVPPGTRHPPRTSPRENPHSNRPIPINKAQQRPSPNRTRAGPVLNAQLPGSNRATKRRTTEAHQAAGRLTSPIAGGAVSGYRPHTSATDSPPSRKA
ncbi:hypothetical protein BDK51DRAFT_44949 [Blyttiomyces helicus]|uniref:Peptidase A1 domain-containing protein n=1 Tax=Blyttiomyces helicus TaxID=388810 RepID=A0A4P9W6E1_9FUNG|nr:hypothetical protein BDK51DRAFT_44949 [Blyttiomyces helicus]|eukprot:RKO87552.1 hypothetical protein BDK51DRAFT_44949 [Blyttiomyces helicus]